MPNDSYFQGNPISLDISRCRFHRAPRWTGSWVVGKLVPIYANLTIMPGDTLSMSVASAIRMTTPVFPVMDDMDITIEAFFVPHRLILSRKSMSPDVNDSNHSWAAFLGAQDSLLNMPTPGDVKLPSFTVSDSGYLVGGLGDCLGYPIPNIASSKYEVNPLKVLAYASIWNEYFREPSTRSNAVYSITSGKVYLTGSDADASWNNANNVAALGLAQVSRYHGYFGSALPWPQRNTTSVKMPLGDSAPVFSGSNQQQSYLADQTGITWANPVTGGVLPGPGYLGISSSAGGMTTSTGYSNDSKVTPANLYADLSEATAATVNQFRLAVQTQRWYEAIARSGNKMSDLIDGLFSIRTVAVSDRPEYLGGFTAPISISQVAATTAASGQDLGKTGAFSLSNPSGFLFQKSFTEHGTVMIVACCRVRDSFCQGVSRQDTKFDRFDFYWPQFANLGEQPIYDREIWVSGDAVPASSGDDHVFGYQEAWAEYRTDTPDLVTGYAKPTVSGGIGTYLTYCNNFSTTPDLKGFLDASAQKAIVDNTLAVTSVAAGFQLYGQFQFDCNWVRPMPLYSIPGLVDHH